MISQFLFSLWVAVQTSIQQSEFKTFLFILKLQKFKNQRLKIHVTRVEKTWFGIVLNGHIFMFKG